MYVYVHKEDRLRTNYKYHYLHQLVYIHIYLVLSTEESLETVILQKQQAHLAPRI